MITFCTKASLRVSCFSAALLIMALAGCHRLGRQYKSPPGYDLANPNISKLPGELDDVSGIAYYVKDNSIFAESDQKGCLYKIPLNKPSEIRKWKFSHKKDYEDIVLLDSTFYVLNNNGNIVTLNFEGDSIATHEFTFPENGKYEFESLYYDDTLHKLVLICKDCDVDKSAGTSTYTFDPRQKNYGSSFEIDTRSVADMTGPKTTKFKPSAASINPVTGELYILSAVNKLLVVAERGGAIKKIYRLDPKIFNQPEGIAFAPSGNLFISNEAGDMQPATLLFYAFKKADNQ